MSKETKQEQEEKYTPPPLPPIEPNEIRIILSGGNIQGMRRGEKVNLSKLGLSLSVLDYDIEGVTLDEMKEEPDSYFQEHDLYGNCDYVQLRSV